MSLEQQGLFTSLNTDMDGNKSVQAMWQSKYLYVGECYLGTRDHGFGKPF